MMNKKPTLVVIIVFILAFAIYGGFFRKEKPIFTLIQVSRGTISQEIFETGQVKKGEEINLSFKSGGTMEKIYVEVGEEIKEGKVLAKLERVQLEIQLQEAEAALALSQAQLNKLLAGAGQEEIQVAQTTVDNAKISLEAAQQNLKDVENTAEENLNQAYQDSLNVLDDSYLKIYNAFNVVDLIQRTYFAGNDQEGIKVRENKDKIETVMVRAKSYLDTAKSDSKNENVDTALSEMETALSNTSLALNIIRETCEIPSCRNLVSSTDKTSLDTQRTYINTAQTNITNSQQTISSTKITNESNINTAQSEVSTAEGAIAAAKDNLSLLTAPPKKADLDLYQAQVDQAKSKVQLLEKQIEDTILRSPVRGQITKIEKRVGEIAQSQNTIITLLPADPFKIEVDIYEEDVVKVNINNPVDISLIAFPEQIFKGKVISIDPAEKLIESVVYYKAVINFEETPDNLKPGMTADVVIKTATKENVLIIPEEAIQKKDNKTIVEVFEDEVIKSKKIEVGLEGSNDMVEVLSGLEQGEEIILR